MPTMRPERWFSKDGFLEADCMLLEYADTLLRELPSVYDDAPNPELLASGYRGLTIAMVRAARRYHRATDLNNADEDRLCERGLAHREACRQEAMAKRAAWNAAHLQLVASKLSALLKAAHLGRPLDLVLLAERETEELTADIDGYTA